MIDIDRCLREYAGFFENLVPEDLDRFDQVFSPDARFKDPFNDVHGVEAIRRVFEHMYTQCSDPRFTVSDYCGRGDRGYLSWCFSFTRKSGLETVSLEGLSRVSFDDHGRVLEHIDYWDPAEQVYARLPVIGWIIGMIRSRLSAR